MFISVLGPCRGCTLRPAGPPECGAFAARLNAAHFKLLQQDTSGQAQTGLLRFLCGLAGRLPPLPRRRRRGSRRARRRRRRHGLDIIRRMLPGSAFGVDLVVVGGGGLGRELAPRDARYTAYARHATDLLVVIHQAIAEFCLKSSRGQSVEFSTNHRLVLRCI